MQEICFNRIKQFAILLFTIMVIAVLYFRCSAFDKDVNCKAKLTLKVINNSVSLKNVEFTNFKENYKREYVSIKFSDTTANIIAQENRTFTFEYLKTGNNECFFDKVFFEDYRVDVSVKAGDTVISRYQIYPFDTTITFQRVCTNCTYEYKDSLILK